MWRLGDIMQRSLPPWLCLLSGTCCGRSRGSGEKGSLKHVAERDLCRLKWNWFFVMLLSMVGSLNVTCILSTNHPYIVNPTPEHINSNSSVEEVEPGLQMSEDFYAFTHTVFYIGSVLAAIICGILFNVIPTWYLFMSVIVFHITSYVFYSLATEGWMMLVARGMAGMAVGASITCTFTYLGVSHYKYIQCMKQLGLYEEGAAARCKGFIFSLYNIGNLLGYGIGGGFPIILAQFYDTPQFRPAGWFCMSVGILLLLLQLALFHGEFAWNFKIAPYKKWFSKLPSCRPMDEHQLCCLVIPAFLIVIGSMTGIRYLIPTAMLTPIVADSFGYSPRDSVYLTTIFFVGSSVGIFLTYTLQYFKISSYALTTAGLVCTIGALLLMTDWQAIGRDPCTAYSIWHHPQLVNYYEEQLHEQKLDKGPGPVHSQDHKTRLCSTTEARYNNVSVALYDTTCERVRSCEWNNETEPNEIFQVMVTQTPSEVCFDRVRVQKHSKKRTSLNRKATNTVQCYSHHRRSAAHSPKTSCFLLQDTNETMDESLLMSVHIQNFNDLGRGEVYQLAVNRCEAGGAHCHWIPNSQLTHKHCSDCQPICRDSRRTLHFAQFAIGLVFFFSTFTFFFTGIFLLLSDSVSKTFQGLSVGLLVALSGIMKIISPPGMAYLYEEAENRTYLLMLTMVGFLLPLLVGLVLLYSCIARQIQFSQPTDNTIEEEECELIQVGTHSDSD